MDLFRRVQDRGGGVVKSLTVMSFKLVRYREPVRLTEQLSTVDVEMLRWMQRISLEFHQMRNSAVVSLLSR